METMATATATTRAMTTAMRWQATKRVTVRAARAMRTVKKRAMVTAARAMVMATNEGKCSKCKGHGDKGVGQGTATLTKRAMATATRMVGNEESTSDRNAVATATREVGVEEGNDEGGKGDGNGDGNKEGDGNRRL
jgi:hypothetical protein